MPPISIIGFGRFGKTLYRLLKGDFEITLYDKREIKRDSTFIKTTLIARNIQEAYENNIIFYAVPISEFEKVITSHKKYFRERHLLIDVLSVKSYPAGIFRKHLKNTKTQALLTHPLFGPDSSKNGFTDLPLVIDRFLASKTNYVFWKNFFVKKGLRVIEMSAREHDRVSASSQGITHLIGRLLAEYKFKPTPIDTTGAKKLHEVMEQTCNDTWTLFRDLQTQNPYTKSMRLRVQKAYNKVYKRLLPKKVDEHYTIFGIQGGIGSFNEEAILHYTKEHSIQNPKIHHLYTTEKVLKNLHEGTIDFGLFAIQNAIGGVVAESTHAMAKHTFKIVDEFAIKIRHFLMKRKDVDVRAIKTIMAHPQVFKQCKSTLLKKFPHLMQKSGTGDLLDTARAARALKEGRIPKNTAILGPNNLATIYNFDIIEEDLQDDSKNLTTFFLVSRP